MDLRMMARGEGIVVKRGEEVVVQWAVPAMALCSSYSAEMAAMSEALLWLGDSEEWNSAVVVTDSRALMEAL